MISRRRRRHYRPRATTAKGFVQTVATYDSAGSTVSSAVIAPAHNTTSGNSLIGCVKLSSGLTPSSITDSQGNTWVLDKAAGSTGANASIWRAKLTTALSTSDSITVNFGGSSIRASILILEVGGLTASPVDITVAQVNPSGTSATADSSPTQTSQASEFAVAAMALGGGDQGSITYSPVPGSWAALYSAAQDYVGVAYQQFSTQQVLTVTLFAGGGGVSNNNSIALVSYKLSS